MRAQPSRLLDQRYEILEEVGRGGMAVVYRGRDRRLGNREVAIKVLHPHLTSSEDARRRFKREADAAAQLEHDNILKVYDASGIDARDTYIVMEFVHGQTLREVIDARTFRLPEIGAMIAHQVACALRVAHEAGIVHRDVKPENILVRDDGVVKLTDFGIARVADQQQMTITGAMIGSPAHMSPEQIEGRSTDARSDVFSLGILLYYVTTGVLPFQAPSPHAVLHKILVGRYEPAERVNPSVGRRLSRIVDRALERQPEDRFQSAEAMVDELSDALREVGVDEPALELRTWFADPEASEQSLRDRIVTRLLDLAEQAAAGRRRAAALGAVDRVLSLDDGNPRATELLARLTRQRRWGRFSAGAAIAGVVSALVIWGLSSLPAPPPPLEMPSGRALSAAPLLAGPRLAEPVPVQEPEHVVTLRGPEEPTRPDTLSRRAPAPTPRAAAVVQPVKPPLPSAAPVPVDVTTYPPAVRISVDGVFRGYGKALHIMLPPGPHSVELEHPTCSACQRTVHTLKVKPDTPLQLRLPIRFKPAKLTVYANTHASVRIAGTAKDYTNRAFEVPMSGPEPVEKTVTVEAPGYETAMLRVELRPGEPTARTVTLHPVAPPQ